MFVEARPVKGGKKKYYLIHSYRKDGKVKKIRKYLGLGLNKKELREKKEHGKKEIEAQIKAISGIGDPYQTVLSAAEFEKLKSLQPSGKIKLTHLSEEEWLRFSESFAYDTNAIEGSTVEKKEVKEILEQNKWPNKPKEEISETFGVADAVKYIRSTKTHISVDFIKELHKIVFRNSKTFAGKLRGIGEEVVVVNSAGNIIHRGAPSAKVYPLLQKLVAWYEKNKGLYPPLVLAAVIHNQFENIHPFRDGNGRVGRLLLINILLKHKLPPINIELKNRREYYTALQSYENEGNLRPMIELMLKEYKNLSKTIKR
jgi:Fic family protein